MGRLFTRLSYPRHQPSLFDGPNTSSIGGWIPRKQKLHYRLCFWNRHCNKRGNFSSLISMIFQCILYKITFIVMLMKTCTSLFFSRTSLHSVARLGTLLKTRRTLPIMHFASTLLGCMLTTKKKDAYVIGYDFQATQIYIVDNIHTYELFSHCNINF